MMDKVWLVTQYTIVWNKVEGERIFRRAFSTSESAEQAVLGVFFSQMEEMLRDEEEPLDHAVLHWTEDWTSDKGVWYLGALSRTPESELYESDERVVWVELYYLVVEVPIE